MVYDTRLDFILPHVVKKEVLDLGPAELVGTVHQHKRERWVFGRVSEVASRLVGLEKSPEQVKALSALGHDIREGDAEDFDIHEQFDVIVAGELIEHLSNPGRFLDCSRRHLKEGGKLLITTPNRFGISSFFRVVRTGKVPRYEKPIAKHVMCFDSDLLTSLLVRHGFKTVQIDYCKWVGAASSKVLERLGLYLVEKVRPPLLNTMVVVAMK
jgi:SAM-dependent methyltransferase